MENIELHITNFKKDFSPTVLTNAHKKTVENDTIEDIAFGMRITFFYDEIKNGKTSTFAYTNDFLFHYSIDCYDNSMNLSWDILSHNEKTNTYCYINDYTTPLTQKLTKEVYLKKAISLPLEDTQFTFKKIKPSFDFNEKLLTESSDKSFKSLFPLILKEFHKENNNFINAFKNLNINYDSIEMSNFNKTWKSLLKENLNGLYNGETETLVKTFDTNIFLNNLNKNLPLTNNVIRKGHKL